MTRAREIMTPDPVCVSESDTVRAAAEVLAEKGIGAVPVCGEDNRLKGMVTDRDIVVKLIAEGKDPRALTAGELAQGEAITIGADDEVNEIMSTMAKYKVRRLPVIDGQKLVGIISLADVARALPNPQVGDLLEAISVDS
jgi:CBS domain-containing protein